MSSNRRFAVKLAILKNAHQGLMVKLHRNSKIWSDISTRASYLTDNHVEKFQHSLMKSFPDIPDKLEKLTGYKEVAAHANEIVKDLNDLYETMVAVQEFKDPCASLLDEISKALAKMDLNVNKYITVSWMNLMVSFVELIFMLTQISQRNSLFILYAVAKKITSGTIDSHFNRTAKFLKTYSNPVKRLQESMSRTVSDRLGEILVDVCERGWLELLFTFNAGGTHGKTETIPIEENGLLDITFDKAPPLNENVYSPSLVDLQESHYFHRWMVLGLLACPSEIPRSDLCQKLLSILNDSLTFLIFRDTIINIHEEFETLISWYKFEDKSKGLSKKMIAESRNKAMNQGVTSHRYKRTYFMQELSNLYHLISYSPGLLGPKLAVVMACLSLSKAELIWYFTTYAIVSNGNSKIRIENLKDSRITSHIRMQVKLHQLVIKNHSIIKQYCIESLTNIYLPEIESLIMDVLTTVPLEDPLVGILQSTISTIKQLPNTQEFDLRAFRLNWLRAEAFWSSHQQKFFITKDQRMRAVAMTMLDVIDLSNYIDNLVGKVDELSGIYLLWFWKDTLNELFDDVLSGSTGNPIDATTILYVYQKAHKNGHDYAPDERIFLGKSAVAACTKRLQRIANKIPQLAGEVAENESISLKTLDTQTKPVVAALMTQAREGLTDGEYVTEDSIVKPGSESKPEKKDELDLLQVNYYLMNEFSHGMSALGHIFPVFDINLAPTEFLYESISQYLSNFLKKSIPSDDSLVFSEFENKWKRLLLCFKEVENQIHIDIAEIAEQVLLKECWPGSDKFSYFAENAGRFGTDVSTNKVDVQVPRAGIFISQIFKVFKYFLDHRINQSADVVYSELRYGFESKANQSYRAEDHFSLSEMRALGRMIGPAGIRYIDFMLVMEITREVSQLKRFLAINESILEQFKESYFKKDFAWESLKIDGMDLALDRSIKIGSILHLRNLLREAKEMNMREFVPFAFSNIRNMVDQYELNVDVTPDFLQADGLAAEVGLYDIRTDQVLRNALESLAKGPDIHLWTLLPYLYALSFTAPAWSSAKFILDIDGNNNNINSMAICIYSLLSIFCMYQRPGLEVEDDTAEKEINRYIEVSSFILSSIQGRYNLVVNFNSMVLFIDTFRQAGNLVSSSKVEKYIPHSLVRSSLLPLYDSNRPKVGRSGSLIRNNSLKRMGSFSSSTRSLRSGSQGSGSLSKSSKSSSIHSATINQSGFL